MGSESPQPSVLVADGDPAFIDFYRRYFERAGWRLHTVGNGDAALKAATAGNYDVIIADYALSQIDGLQLLRGLREQNPSQSVIVMVAGGGLPEAIAALKAGACDVVQKPVDLVTLERSVQQALWTGPQLEFENEVYGAAVEEETFFVFSCAELSRVKMPLLIADRLYKAGRMDYAQRLRLELAFQEALANAVDHGCLELDSRWREEIDEEGIDRYSRVKRERLADPRYAERKVTVRMGYRVKKITIEVRDEGRGFLDGQREMTVTADSIACHGRGLTIMRGSVDELYYHENGTRVTLVKYL